MTVVLFSTTFSVSSRALAADASAFSADLEAFTASAWQRAAARRSRRRFLAGLFLP